MRKGSLHRSIDDKVIVVEDDEEPTAEDGTQFFPAQAEHLRPRRADVFHLECGEGRTRPTMPIRERADQAGVEKLTPKRNTTSSITDKPQRLPPLSIFP